MGTLWSADDNMTASRRNREAIIGRLLLPAYDVNEAGTTTWAVKAVDGDDIVSVETTHYTAGAGLNKAVLHYVTLTNNSGSDRNAQVHIVENGGSRSAANAIHGKTGGVTIFAGETITLEGPWFLDPSDTLRSISSDAAANEVALAAVVSEAADALTGVALVVKDGVALTATLVSQYVCPGSGVEHAEVLAVTVCNTDSADRTVTVEVRPSGGSQSDKQNRLAESVVSGESLIFGGISLEPGDAIFAKASVASVVSFRVSPVEFATTP